ncbi:MAG: hypothetical protein M3462_15055 [Chloroflexota bacterium]|nr:hypothetical protein [Chloroflexota bacterium]
MTRRGATLGAILATCLVLAAALAIPVDVRHSAPFGFRLTLDPDRAIAVTGVTVTPNYPDFHRVDLDLRAYTPDERYDVTVYVQEVPLPVADDEGDAAGADEVTEPEPPAEAGPLRTVHLGLDQAEIAAEKGAFADPFVTVRFDPIADSAGKAYYVWVDTGANNDDAVLTVWSVKSYSRVAGHTTLAAFLADSPGSLPSWAGRVIFGAAMVTFALAMAALGAALAGASERPAVPIATRRGGDVRARSGSGSPD